MKFALCGVYVQCIWRMLNIIQITNAFQKELFLLIRSEEYLLV